MSDNDPSIVLYVAGLVAALIVLILSIHIARSSSKRLGLAAIDRILETFPLAEVLVVLFAIPSLNWTLMISILLGAALNNMFVSSAMSISASQSIGGAATFPLCIAAFLCFVPLALAGWALILGPEDSLMEVSFETLIIGILVTSVFLAVTYAITIPITQIMIRRQIPDERTQTSQVNPRSSNISAPTSRNSTADVLSTVDLRQDTSEQLEAQDTSPDVILSETSSLLRPEHGDAPPAKDTWRHGSILAFSMCAVLFAAAATSDCIRKIGGHHGGYVVKAALIAGLVMGAPRALPVVHRVLCQPTRADLIAATKLYGHNLLLSLFGQLILAFFAIAVDEYTLPLMLVAPVWATIFAAAGVWSDTLLWVVGLPGLVFTLFPLALVLIALTGAYKHLAGTSLADLQASILLT